MQSNRCNRVEAEQASPLQFHPANYSMCRLSQPKRACITNQTPKYCQLRCSYRLLSKSSNPQDWYPAAAFLARCQQRTTRQTSGKRFQPSQARKEAARREGKRGRSGKALAKKGLQHILTVQQSCESDQLRMNLGLKMIVLFSSPAKHHLTMCAGRQDPHDRLGCRLQRQRQMQQ